MGKQFEQLSFWEKDGLLIGIGRLITGEPDRDVNRQTETERKKYVTVVHPFSSLLSSFLFSIIHSSLSLPAFLSLALYRAFVLKAVVVLGLTVHCSVSHSLCNSDSVKGWMTGSLWKEERKGNPPPSTAND